MAEGLGFGNFRPLVQSSLCVPVLNGAYVSVFPRVCIALICKYSVCVCVCVYIHTYIHTYVHTYIHTYVVCIHVIYIYTYTYRSESP